MDSQLAGITRISELKWRSPLSGCWEGPTDFSLQNMELLVLWEYCHRRDARIGNNARWFIMVGSEGLLWYIIAVEWPVGIFSDELVFFAPKSPR